MKTLTPAIVWTALMLASAGLPARDSSSFGGIEALMTAQEYEAAGIGKLSAAEREALNRWLIRYTVEDSKVLLRTNEEVIKAAQEQEIFAVIQRPFSGWSGDTIFTLDNGQVWQQRRRGNYHHIGSSTDIRITKNLMGFYRMELLENGQSVQVKRLK
ncbi:MAG: hypothetical protein DRR04_03040 [Gammaproteobacteria bacterium]|nr:MAG: hypothetical protein DRQ97_06175 [Gammaproteobacteria bacterium]RLA61393.1 MAG: hypothetical protein DRR04_03040 [Gammaproteobacteria bacterium]